MSKNPDHRSSAVEFDGALMFVVNSPEMTLHTAQADQGKFTAPCNGTIVKCVANLIEAPGTAAGGIDIGKQGDADYFTATGVISFGTGHALGAIDITSSLTNTDVNEGDVIEFGTDGNATTTGLIAVTLVISPNAA